MMKRTFLLVASLFLIVATLIAHGFDLRFLNNSPARHFTKQDWDIAKTTIRDLLENREPGDTVSWNNPDTGNSGEISTIKVDDSGETVCKSLQITNRAKGLEGKGNYVFCKQADGKWKVVEPK